MTLQWNILTFLLVTFLSLGVHFKIEAQVIEDATRSAQVSILSSSSYSFLSKKEYNILNTPSVPKANSFDFSQANDRYQSDKYFLTKQKGMYCETDLALFCRLEVRLEKASKIPVKFRLGDVQYVDYLEGKFEAWRYNY